MTIRVAVVDDQALIRAGFVALISSTADQEVVGEAADGAAAVELVRSTTPDVVLMDIRMPGTDGIAATELICRDPALVDTRILVLTTFEEDEYVVAALKAGASGFLGKDVGPIELLDGIRTVAAGEALLSARATRALIGRFLAQPMVGPGGAPEVLDVLTGREREIVTLVGHGLTNAEIAEQLVVSPLTAKTHVNRAMVKLGVRDRAQLVVVAFQTGLVTVGDARPTER
ncbi:MAG: response regulator [Candidatus Nanopelagicales bacterium]